MPDHKSVVFTLREDTDVGKGYWKFNARLLIDDGFTLDIQNTIRNITNQYSKYLDK